MQLAAKVAIITVGAQRIGRATVGRVHADDAQLAMFDPDAGRGVALADAFAERPLLFVPCDVTDEAAVAAGTTDVVTRLGRLDALVNNASANAEFDAATMTEAEWCGVFAVALTGTWRRAKHAIPALRRADGGAILNIASIHEFMTIDGMVPYAAATAGLVGLTRGRALDLGTAGIRVNAVCPDWTRTQLVQEWSDRQPNPTRAGGGGKRARGPPHRPNRDPRRHRQPDRLPCLRRGRLRHRRRLADRRRVERAIRAPSAECAQSLGAPHALPIPGSGGLTARPGDVERRRYNPTASRSHSNGVRRSPPVKPLAET